MASTFNFKMLGKAEQILAVLFAFGAILGFLLTPLGFETRSNELRTLAWAAFFIVVGLLVPIAGLILIFRKPRLAALLAIVEAALMFLVAPADQALFFFTIAPPIAVAVGEFILIFVAIGYLIYGIRIYDKGQSAKTG